MSSDRAETTSAVLSFDPYDGRRGRGRSDQPEAVRHVRSLISSNRGHTTRRSIFVADCVLTPEVTRPSGGPGERTFLPKRGLTNKAGVQSPSNRNNWNPITLDEENSQTGSSILFPIKSGDTTFVLGPSWCSRRTRPRNPLSGSANPSPVSKHGQPTPNATGHQHTPPVLRPPLI